MSAGDQFVPPFPIFPRVQTKQELKDGAPPRSEFACHPSGWIQLSIFTEWLRHFVAHTKPSKNDPVLLVMDGHMTQTKNLDVINLARDSHVTILYFPPHCSHQMQPLDVSFMKPLSAFYVKAIETFLRNNPGRQVAIYKLSALFGESYLQAAVPNTTINGFRKTGFFPLNSQICGEADFLPAHPTDIPFNGEPDEQDLDDPVVPPIMALENEADLEGAVEPENPNVVPLPVMPKMARSLVKPGSSPQDIIPLPKVATTVRNKRARPQGRALVFQHPHIRELESEIQKKKEKDLALAQKRQEREDKKKEKLATAASNKQPSKRMTKQKKREGREYWTILGS